ncbi:hypothetical protein RND81_02G038600 [Saponaria officinalis]|uniref:Uncharacterized protein n=1 Tax=Saponaria officinalis TaxID=3572 RepID=A0AAW1MPN5_SAPOF
MTVNHQNTVIIIIVTLLLTCNYSSFVRATIDNQLIGRVCGSSKYPTVCENCVNYMGRTTDIKKDVDVTIAMVQCADGVVSDLMVVTRELVLHQQDSQVISRLYGCVTNFINARVKGDNILVDLNNGSLPNASGPKIPAVVIGDEDQSGIGPAFNVYTELANCVRDFKGFTMPPIMVTGIQNLRNHYHIILDLLCAPKGCANPF